MAPLPHCEDFRAVWLETTKDKHQHGGEGWEFGTCLWSPVRNKRNALSYRLMKEPRIGDLVLHNYEYTLTDASIAKAYFCGHSCVARGARQITDDPRTLATGVGGASITGSIWSGFSGYRPP